MELVTSDPAVQAAIISSVGGVLAAVIAACAAAVIGQRFANQKKLRSRIEVLQGDLLFLWAVQQEYARRYGDKIGVRGCRKGAGLFVVRSILTGQARCQSIGQRSARGCHRRTNQGGHRLEFVLIGEEVDKSGARRSNCTPACQIDWLKNR